MLATQETPSYILRALHARIPAPQRRLKYEVQFQLTLHRDPIVKRFYDDRAARAYAFSHPEVWMMRRMTSATYQPVIYSYAPVNFPPDTIASLT